MMMFAQRVRSILATLTGAARGGTRLTPALLVVAATALPLAALPLAAQQAERSSTDVVLDSVSLAYRFTPGEEITYRVVSLDSMRLPARTEEGGRQVTRQRVEVIHYRCDTVLPQGIVLTATLKDYVAVEQLDSLPPATRTSHPWVGRSITFLMTPDGRRVDMLRYAKENGVAAGAPFQPGPVPFIGPDSSYIGQSGMYNVEQFVFDNAFPPPFWSGATYRIVRGRVDTLGAEAIHLTLTETGQLKYYPPPEKGQDSNAVYVHTVVNGAGEYYYSPKRGVMIGGRHDVIGRITMMSSKDPSIKALGRHIIHMSFSELRTD